MSKVATRSGFSVEALEGRRLMTVVIISSSFDPIVAPVDPIVGPIGTTPGTIGVSNNNLGTGGGLFVSVGGGGFVVIGSNNGINRPTRNGEIDSDLFFRRGFPFVFSTGTSMKMKGATLTISGTGADDTIEISERDDRNGKVLGLDITVNGQTKRLENTFGRFVRAITVDAGRGDDVVSGDETLEIPMTVHGGKGNDSLAGGSRNDWLFGEDGNDVLLGGVGNDTLNGGNGNDTLEGSDGGDRLVGGAGKDQSDGDEEDLISGVEG